MNLQILNKTDLRINKERLEELTSKITDKLNIKSKNIEISLKITGSNEIKKLNKKYRNKNVPTDVLSFPVDKLDSLTQEKIMLGDIVVAKDYVKKEKDLEELFAHGLLHLLGYDHEKDEKEWNRALRKI